MELWAQQTLFAEGCRGSLSTQDIERTLGRTQKSTDGQYHDRPIDIDILLYDDLHVNEPDLVIPHPHMNERQFVLQPLSEIIE